MSFTMRRTYLRGIGRSSRPRVTARPCLYVGQRGGSTQQDSLGLAPLLALREASLASFPRRRRSSLRIEGAEVHFAVLVQQEDLVGRAGRPE